MQRKKKPLLSALPSVLHSNCSTKLSNSFSVTRSPGPFLTDSSPSFVTSHFDAIRFGSAALIFHPSRLLPSKRAFAPTGRSFTDLRERVPPPGASIWSCVCPLLEPLIVARTPSAPAFV